MLAPFAALEARTNAVVGARLANAVALVSGVSVPVIFDDPYAAPFGGEVDASAPECSGPSDLLGGLVRGDQIVIGEATFAVMTCEPDGIGFVRLVLGSR